MSYTVQQLSQLAGVSVRTLHHYDEIGLLSPNRKEKNGYRQYEESDLLTLQHILFFKELEFPLNEIKRIMNDPSFNKVLALQEHRKLIEIKKQRMNSLLKTIDNTLKKMNEHTPMHDEDLYDGFSKEEMDAWNKEAEERWGNTDQYKQSLGKYESLTKEQKLRMKEDGDKLMEALVANMEKGPNSPEVQALIQQHYDALRFFYEPNITLYRGLADMYIGYQGDDRFRAYFEKYHENLPEFMHDAIYAYCDAHA